MLGNDSLGDCAIAAAAHAEMLWAVRHRRPRSDPTLEQVTDAYSKITGYQEGHPDAPAQRAMMTARWVPTESGTLVTSKPRVAISPRTANREAAPASRNPHTEPVMSLIPCDWSLAVPPYTPGAPAATPPNTTYSRVNPGAAVLKFALSAVLLSTVPRTAPTPAILVTQLSLAVQAGPACTEPVNHHQAFTQPVIPHAHNPARPTAAAVATALHSSGWNRSRLAPPDPDPPAVTMIRPALIRTPQCFATAGTAAPATRSPGSVVSRA